MKESAGRSMRAGLALGAVLAGACFGGEGAARPYLRALVLSDLNGSGGTVEYTAEVSHAVALARGELRPDLVLIPGDMVAGQQPGLTEERARAMWASFDRTVFTPLHDAGIPIVFTLGNHDGAVEDRFAHERRISTEYWRRRVDGDALPFVDRQHFPHRYTVRFGDVFIAVWDAAHGASGADDALVDWLEDALESDASEDARHRVVLAHVPIYDVSGPTTYPGGVLENGDDLREDLEAWGATMMVTGHHHAYYPGRRGALELMHAGSLGTYPRALKGDAAAPRKTITVIDFWPDSVHVTGYEMEGATATPLPLEALPPVICADAGWVARRDLVDVEPQCGRKPLWRRMLGL